MSTKNLYRAHGNFLNNCTECAAIQHRVDELCKPIVWLPPEIIVDRQVAMARAKYAAQPWYRRLSSTWKDFL